MSYRARTSRLKGVPERLDAVQEAFEGLSCGLGGSKAFEAAGAFEKLSSGILGLGKSRALEELGA